MNWLGLDIGGANIKVASTDGLVSSMPFRFWVEHDRLQAVLLEIIKNSAATNVAVTMTAELADCFPSRKFGVENIVDCVESVCEELNLPPPIFAGTDIEFRSADQAKAFWQKTAASNWAVLAQFAARFFQGSGGLVVDMGSTTTDIIPVENGNVAAVGKTDSQRLQNGELVYVGADRTPVCSVVDSLKLAGVQTPVAREFFATVGDAMLLCGYRKEDSADTDTADGRPRTIECAATRICKMVCEDAEDLAADEAEELARQILSRVNVLITRSIDSHDPAPKEIIVTGSGLSFSKLFIENSFLEASVTTLSSFVNDSIDDIAPAYAVAVLASERNVS